MKGLAKGGFLEVLKEAAERLKITLYELGKRAGIPRSSLYYYAKNPGKLSLEKAEKVRKLAGVSREEWDKWMERAVR